MDQEKKSGQLHLGHRERMRFRFRKTLGNGFAPHELLEMILFYALPRGDTNELAHALLKNYESLPEMFMNCTYDDFIRVDGVGEKTANMLAVIGAAFKSDRVHVGQKMFLKTIEERKNFFIQEMEWETSHDEIILAACLSEKMQIMRCEVLERGSVGQVSVSAGKLTKFVFHSNCSRVILAHNHLNGAAEPSYEDVLETKRLILRPWRESDAKPYYSR